MRKLQKRLQNCSVKSSKKLEVKVENLKNESVSATMMLSEECVCRI